MKILPDIEDVIRTLPYRLVNHFIHKNLLKDCSSILLEKHFKGERRGHLVHRHHSKVPQQYSTMYKSGKPQHLNLSP